MTSACIDPKTRDLIEITGQINTVLARLSFCDNDILDQIADYINQSRISADNLDRQALDLMNQIVAVYKDA